MKAPIPESEEQLITDYIYTTYLIQTLEDDHQTAASMNFKIPEAYQVFIESKLKILRTELVKLKSQMRELKIKVVEPKRVNVEFVQYDYFAHGYEGHMRFWDAAMEYEGTRRMKELFKGPL